MKTVDKFLNKMIDEIYNLDTIEAFFDTYPEVIYKKKYYEDEVLIQKIYCFWMIHQSGYEAGYLDALVSMRWKDFLNLKIVMIVK